MTTSQQVEAIGALLDKHVAKHVEAERRRCLEILNSALMERLKFYPLHTLTGLELADFAKRIHDRIQKPREADDATA